MTLPPLPPHPAPFSTLVVPWIGGRLEVFLFIVGRNDSQTLREKMNAILPFLLELGGEGAFNFMVD